MKRLLLVEDEPDNARMMARMLRMRGYEVVLADDGQTAIEMASQFLPDVIIMDLLLAGGIDGLEATRRIKSEAATRDIPIIVLSAMQLVAFQTQAIEAGAAEVDDKPVDFDRLIGKIETVLLS